MCSFIFSTKYNNEDIDDLNYYLKFRGPDHTEIKKTENMLFVHNLLHITGNFKTQPIVEDDIILLYNGEIYNYNSFGDYESDGCCIIPLYKEFGVDFIKKLDGEFAICLIDLANDRIVISSDIFKTKPLFFSVFGNEIGCASYLTPLKKLGHKNIRSAKPNTTYVISLSKGWIEEFPVCVFSLNQHKDTYEDWILAFKQAVEKRTVNTKENFFIGLSSGYDSGIIYSELLNRNIIFYTFTLIGTENNMVLEERFKLKNENTRCFNRVKHKNDNEINHSPISQTTEPFRYTIHSSSSSYNEYDTMLINDSGSNYFATLCWMAKQHNCKICFSGTGADEILADYGYAGKKIYQHSNFGGLFPKDLSSIFPWASFYGSSMESYIAKEEYVGGSFGIEMRYPFLDKKVVQEFLWLSVDLKNKEYKAPIDYYFTKYNFPYAKMEKKGF